MFRNTGKFLKFIMVICLVFLVSCGPEKESSSSKTEDSSSQAEEESSGLDASESMDEADYSDIFGTASISDDSSPSGDNNQNTTDQTNNHKTSDENNQDRTNQTDSPKTSDENEPKIKEQNDNSIMSDNLTDDRTQNSIDDKDLETAGKIVKPATSDNNNNIPADREKINLKHDQNDPDMTDSKDEHKTGLTPALAPDDDLDWGAPVAQD